MNYPKTTPKLSPQPPMLSPSPTNIDLESNTPSPPLRSRNFSQSTIHKSFQWTDKHYDLHSPSKQTTFTILPTIDTPLGTTNNSKGQAFYEQLKKQREMEMDSEFYRRFRERFDSTRSQLLFDRQNQPRFSVVGRTRQDKLRQHYDNLEESTYASMISKCNKKDDSDTYQHLNKSELKKQQIVYFFQHHVNFQTRKDTHINRLLNHISSTSMTAIEPIASTKDISKHRPSFVHSRNSSDIHATSYKLDKKRSSLNQFNHNTQINTPEKPKVPPTIVITTSSPTARNSLMTPSSKNLKKILINISSHHHVDQNYSHLGAGIRRFSQETLAGLSPSMSPSKSVMNKAIFQFLTSKSPSKHHSKAVSQSTIGPMTPSTEMTFDFKQQLHQQQQHNLKAIERYPIKSLASLPKQLSQSFCQPSKEYLSSPIQRTVQRKKDVKFPAELSS